jgi:hypothetical protein
MLAIVSTTFFRGIVCITKDPNDDATAEIKTFMNDRLLKCSLMPSQVSVGACSRNVDVFMQIVHAIIIAIDHVPTFRASLQDQRRILHPRNPLNITEMRRTSTLSQLDGGGGTCPLPWLEPVASFDDVLRSVAAHVIGNPRTLVARDDLPVDLRLGTIKRWMRRRMVVSARPLSATAMPPAMSSSQPRQLTREVLVPVFASRFPLGRRRALLLQPEPPEEEPPDEDLPEQDPPQEEPPPEEQPAPEEEPKPRQPAKAAPNQKDTYARMFWSL